MGVRGSLRRPGRLVRPSRGIATFINLASWILLCILLLPLLYIHQIRSKQPDLLLLIPIHYSSVYKFPKYAERLSQRPMSRTNYPVDVLCILYISNTSQPSQMVAMQQGKETLETLTSVHQVFIAVHTLDCDDYDRDRKSQSWVCGPNEIFYSAMLSGNKIYDEYVSRYQFVFQMEMDVYPIRDAWVDEIGRVSRSDNLAIIFGSRVQEELFFHSKNKSCEKSVYHYDYVQNHINGNALYRVSESLQASLRRALESHPNWPFDLGLYLSLKQDENLFKVGYRDFILNKVTPVDENLALDSSLYKESTFFVHLSSYLVNRESKWDAVKCHIKVGAPMLIYMIRNPQDLVRVLQPKALKQVQSTVEVVSISCTKEVTDAILASYNPAKKFIEDWGCQELDQHFANLCEGRSCIFVEGSSVVTRDGISWLRRNIKGAVGITTISASLFTGIQVNNANLPIVPGILYIPDDQALYSSISAHGSFFVELYASKSCKNICSIDKITVKAISKDVYAFEEDFLLGFPVKRSLLRHQFLLGVSQYLQAPQISLGHQSFMLNNDLKVQEGCERLVMSEKGLMRVSGRPCQVQTLLKLILELIDVASKTKADCLVLPQVYDHIMDTIVNLERLFSIDRIAKLSGVLSVLGHDSFHLLPSLPRHIEKVDVTTSCSLKPVLSHIFSDDIEHLAKNADIGRLTLCLQDIDRPLEQTTLTYFDHGLDRVSALFKNIKTVYLAGKWRMIDEKVGGGIQFMTLFKVLHQTEGLSSSLYHRKGEDYVYDFLDAFVCSNIRMQTSLPIATMSTDKMYENLLRHIPANILLEEASVWNLYDSSDSSVIIGRDLLINNGLSNLEGSSQCLRHVAGATNSTAALLPYYDEHLRADLSSWSSIVHIEDLIAMGRWRSTLYPLLRHPSMIFEIFDDIMVPVTREIHNHSSSLTAFWVPVAKGVKSVKLYKNINIARNLDQLHTLIYSGQCGLLGDVPHLGINSKQVNWLQNFFPGRDIALFHSFRSVLMSRNSNFDVNFRKEWRNHYRIRHSLQKLAAEVVDELGEDYTCVHLRLNEEFLTLMDGRPFGRNEAGEALRSRIHENANVFVISDSIEDNLHLFSHHKSKIHSPLDIPGLEKLSPNQKAVLEKSICASATDFLGNIYSSFSLSICGMRNDQQCPDLFGNELKDARLLF